MDNIKTLKIDDREYITVLLPPIKAVALHAKLLSMFGGAAGKLLPQDLGDKVTAMSIIAGALQGVDEKRLPGLILDLVSNVKLGNSTLDKTVFDKHFSAYGGDIYPLASWVVWENTKGFLAQSGGAWSALMQAVGLSSPETM